MFLGTLHHSWYTCRAITRRTKQKTTNILSVGVIYVAWVAYNGIADIYNFLNHFRLFLSTAHPYERTHYYFAISTFIFGVGNRLLAFITANHVANLPRLHRQINGCISIFWHIILGGVNFTDLKLLHLILRLLGDRRRRPIPPASNKYRVGPYKPLLDLAVLAMRNLCIWSSPQNFHCTDNHNHNKLPYIQINYERTPPIHNFVQARKKCAGWESTIQPGVVPLPLIRQKGWGGYDELRPPICSMAFTSEKLL